MPLIAPQKPERALVMAFDERFALGAETSLYSLLRYNRWFDGRVIVLADGLSASSCAALARLYPIEFVNLDPALTLVAERIVRSGRVSREVSRRLYMLQLFSLPGLERAVFLDSDTLCLGDVQALFDSPHHFAAAPDLLQLQRGIWPERADAHEPYGNRLAYSFNTGVISVSKKYLDQDVYVRLLQAPGLVESGGAPQLADQYLLNRAFEGEVAALHPRYNFIVSAEAILRQRYRLTLADVRILHFAGYAKPWQHTWAEARRSVPARFLRYYEAWHEHRQELMAELTSETARDQYQVGLGELSAAARDLGRGTD
jgi:lipopolysaccharide biosynthesis glycosyltransferase